MCVHETSTPTTFFFYDFNPNVVEAVKHVVFTNKFPWCALVNPWSYLTPGLLYKVNCKHDSFKWCGFEHECLNKKKWECSFLMNLIFTLVIRLILLTIGMNKQLMQNSTFANSESNFNCNNSKCTASLLLLTVDTLYKRASFPHGKPGTAARNL